MNDQTLGPYKNLQVWQQAVLFSTELYKATKNFPNEELFGLVSQMRRAAVSIPSNIAEGYGRSSNAELIHFLYIALGSSNEVDTQLEISKSLSYLSEDDCKVLTEMNNEINAKLRSLIKVRGQF